MTTATDDGVLLRFFVGKTNIILKNIYVNFTKVLLTVVNLYI